MLWPRSLLKNSTYLNASISPIATNGTPISTSLDVPYLPAFLENNPLPNNYPWGCATADRTDPRHDIPNTGVIRSYDFSISRGFISPDGYNKSAILINDQFPGPLVEANWGDTIQVTVTNNIDDPKEGTSVHWHGTPMKLTPWYDGTPSVQQCPIAPGSSFTYTFRAEVYGTSWYHAHFSAQYMDGVFGPMIIYGPTQIDYQIDLGPILLTDYFHTPYSELIDAVYRKPPVFLASDNNLINGKVDLGCNLTGDNITCQKNAGVSKFRFQTGQVHRLRLINAGACATQKFTIDNHEMTVIANDFVLLKPYATKVVTLGAGQRSDVLVKATGKATDAVWMRSDLDRACFPNTVNQPHALAAIYYPEADLNRPPSTRATPWSSNNCANDPLHETVPLYQLKPPPNPAVTETLDVTIGLNETGSLVLFVNNSSFRANYNNPLLLLAKLGNTSYPENPQWNVYNFGKNTSIRIVIRNYSDLPHPMHLHGHDFWVLAEGKGEWDGTVTNPQNPQRRDTHILIPGSPETPSYMVMEFMADNPGVWPLHCHIVVHVSTGLYVNIVERPDLIPTHRQIPLVIAQTCRDWARFTGSNPVEQIDSGL